MSGSATKFRTHTCGELRAADIGKAVTLAGFVARRIDDKTVDVRDDQGVTRVVLGKGVPPEPFKAFRAAEPGSVLQLKGACNARAKADPETPTGEVEVAAADVIVLSSAGLAPVDVNSTDVPADDRLKYRTLFLRTPAWQKRLQFRSSVLAAARAQLVGAGFIEVETPLLTRWLPESRASFVVPAGGAGAYALATSPQTHKQLLMASGVGRYFQVARAFRSAKEYGPDSQPETSILDVEMAFVDEEDVLTAADLLIGAIWKAALGKDLPPRVKCFTHAEALEKFGSDRPDNRFDLFLVDLTAIAARSGAADLKAAAASGAVRAIRAPGGAKLADADLEKIASAARDEGTGTSVHWLKLGTGQPTGPGGKLFGGALVGELTSALEAQPGDAAVLVASPNARAATLGAGVARARLGKALDLCKEHALCWITESPFFDYDAATDSYAPARHPFTQPREADLGKLEGEKHAVRTKAFDLVIDGVEVASGSVRNHDMKLQRRVFEMLGYGAQDVERRFGPVLQAFGLGVPPHGGLAIAVDRLVARLQGLDSIDEAIAFPKSRTGTDPMLDAPSPVPPGVVRSLLGA